MTARSSATLLEDYLAEPYEFIAGMEFADEKGQLRNFAEPFQEQILALDDFITPGVHTVCHLKPRQIGDTTVCTAAWFWLIFTSPDPVRCLILANDDDATKNIFGKIRSYWRSLPRWIRKKRKVLSESAGELVFADTGAGFKVLTAGGKGHGRSFTFQMVLAEEMAFWPESKAADVWASVQSTQHEGPYNRTAILSTPNGRGNLYEQKVRQAMAAWERGDAGVRFRFFRWFDHDAYRKAPPKTWEPTEDEWLYGQRFRLDLQQLYWRHDKVWGVKGIGPDKFRKEYPATVEDGFRVIEGSWFDLDLIEALEASLQPATPVDGLSVYEAPVRGRRYVAGVDPSWCFGGDDFVCQIMDEFGKQVAVFATNVGGTHLAAQKAAGLIQTYNKAKTLLERNPGGGGVQTYEVLRDAGVHLYNPGGKPFTTNATTRPVMLGDLRTDFNGDLLDVLDVPTVREMGHFRSRDGKIEGGRPEGLDGVGDDRVMALALANKARRSLPAVSSTRHRIRTRRALPFNPYLALQGGTTRRR